MVGKVTLAQGGVAGDWEVKLTTQTVITTWPERFEQNGHRLDGEIDLGDSEVLPVEGSISGPMLKFVVVVPGPDGDQPISVEGKLAGDLTQGEQGRFVWFGTDSWSASRQ